MVYLLSSFLTSQTPTPGSKEGLPFWTFWFLLCIILLLIIFIFLRDKDLRQRLNSFLFRAKAKLIKMRLQARLKMILRKKEGLIQELGQKAFSVGLKLEKDENIGGELTRLEKNKKGLEKELRETESEISTLQSNLENQIQKFKAQLKRQESRKKDHEIMLAETKEKEKQIGRVVMQKQRKIEETAKEINAAHKEIHKIENNPDLSQDEKKKKKEECEEKIKKLTNTKDNADQKIKRILQEKDELEKEKKKIQEKSDELRRKKKNREEEEKSKNAEFNKEIKEWERNKEKVLGKIKKIERQKEPLFKNFGKLVNKERIEHKELIIFYSKVDRRNKRIEEIRNQMKELDSGSFQK